MAEQPVMIARFSLPTEAQVACGRLQAEGIMAHVLGDGAASAFGIMVGLGGHVELYVSAADADRAQKILAECMPEEQWRVMLDKESQALETNPAEWTSDDRVKPGAEFEGETDSRLWVCSLCGDAVSIKETVCPSCGTARGAATRKE